MLIKSLGYLAVTAPDIGAWREFATRVFAMEAVEQPQGELALRMDAAWGRIFVAAGAEGVAALGLEVADAAALEAVVARLRETGHPIRLSTEEERAKRRVAGLAIGRDPGGNGLEFHYGLATGTAPFAPPRPLSGFRTGALGLGHAVLSVENYDAMMPFYRDVLGFKLTDFFDEPFRAMFLHVNARHHSVALIETGSNAMHHLMVEVQSLDDVGRAYDVMLEHFPDRIAVTLGRHANDHVTSFYAANPSGFMIEYGWGGRDVDDATWVPSRVVLGPSLWGHERLWLPEEKRVEARKMKAKAAMEGARAPLHVSPGEYEPIA